MYYFVSLFLFGFIFFLDLCWPEWIYSRTWDPTCSVNFESQNYTILTSRCKGPQYTPEACCSAFKDFACPFADAINDLTTDCASTMFSYINLYGKYPPGLFANLCREGQLGLNCTNVEEPKEKSNGGQMAATQSTLVLITASLLILFFHWF